MNNCTYLILTLIALVAIVTVIRTKMNSRNLIDIDAVMDYAPMIPRNESVDRLERLLIVNSKTKL